VPYGRRIETTRSLQPGQLVWAVPAGGDPQEWYHFEIVDVNEATFAMTLVGSDASPAFPDGTTLKFRLWREEDARYLFEAALLREDKHLRCWTLRHADSLTRNQSRAYFRLRLEQAVTVAVLNASRDEAYEGIYEREPIIELRGRMTSLSGGGLAVVFQQPVPKQVLLRMAISIPSLGGTLTVAVRPVSSQALSGGRCFVRGTFVAMADETREAITRYIFSKQKLAAGSDPAAR
jgi:c-di-GMP-binding flagellar brake protein YcgR